MCAYFSARVATARKKLARQKPQKLVLDGVSILLS